MSFWRGICIRLLRPILREGGGTAARTEDVFWMEICRWLTSLYILDKIARWPCFLTPYTPSHFFAI